MTDAIERLRELLAKATRRPWGLRTLENFGFNVVHYNDGDKFDIKRVAKAGDETDANLIVEAVNALPGLLDTIATLTAERDAAVKRAEEAELRGRLRGIDQMGKEVERVIGSVTGADAAAEARVRVLEEALREISRRGPATCDMTVVHEMADIATEALRQARA